jgi:hypothetical protein
VHPVINTRVVVANPVRTAGESVMRVSDHRPEKVAECSVHRRSATVRSYRMT